VTLINRCPDNTKAELTEIPLTLQGIVWGKYMVIAHSGWVLMQRSDETPGQLIKRWNKLIEKVDK